jgi:xeroderma pigmentosum group C-complementing protein
LILIALSTLGPWHDDAIARKFPKAPRSFNTTHFTSHFVNAFRSHPTCLFHSVTMPPYVPRKRHHSVSPPAQSPPRKKTVKAGKPHPNVFDTLDSEPKPARTTEENKAYLESLQDEASDSSLSDLESDEFEDVLPTAKRQKTSDDADTDEEMDWEDAVPEVREHHEPSESLRIILSKPDDIDFSRTTTGSKKGPSKIERMVRVQTHCMHVSFLLWHNSIRNAWLNDKELQDILVNGLSEGLKAEVAKWRAAMGYKQEKTSGEEESSVASKVKTKAKSKSKDKGKGKEKTQVQNERDRTRDWGAEASKLEPGVPNLSRGDPILRLLKYLSAYWKKRFTITSPGLRKQGYQSAIELDAEVKSFKQNPLDPKRFGERITSIEEFRQLAKRCEGSRDVGAQLFTALLRGLGLEARLVASLQPTGFGWSKAEEAKSRKPHDPELLLSSAREQISLTSDAGAEDHQHSRISERPVNTVTRPASSKVGTGPGPPLRGTTMAPITIDNSDSELSSVPDSDSDTAVINASPSKPSAVNSPLKPIDKDLHFPVYWTEILSPVSNAYYPVSTLVNPNVATAPENYQVFEPRGAAAEKAKQVICYVTAFAADRTAKDVTVRYLKRHQLPGKTKGFRIPSEKIPVYNRRGKVIKYEKYDWFKRAMSCYTRSSEKRTLADDLEDQGDLIPFKPEKTAKDGSDPKGVETLQGYKSSAEFVLERHLRREEALLPNAEIVKYFNTGKGDKATKEAVYQRKDVVACKTVESWHKEGREILTGEQALKYVPYRAVTIIRKREIEDTTRETGEKPTQGLYSKAQTTWIVPPAIKDGKIPRNVFGNIDVYVPSMVPKGAVHVRLKGTGKICKRLGIDYAEACTGFEFGKQRAVPVLTGVVVAEENEQLLIDAWRQDEQIKKEKEDGKREARSLAMWKKFLYGLRIVQRMNAEYGTGDDMADEVNPFKRHQTNEGADEIENSDEEGEGEGGNGFLVEEDDKTVTVGGGFLLPGQDYDEVEGGFLASIDSDEEADVSMEARTHLEIDLDDDIPWRGQHQSNATKNLNNADRAYPDTPVSLQPAQGDATPLGNDLTRDNKGERTPSEPWDDDESSKDYAPSKSARGTRTHTGRKNTRARPQRNATTSSPYFKKPRK